MKYGFAVFIAALALSFTASAADDAIFQKTAERIRNEVARKGAVSSRDLYADRLTTSHVWERPKQISADKMLGNMNQEGNLFDKHEITAFAASNDMVIVSQHLSGSFPDGTDAHMDVAYFYKIKDGHIVDVVYWYDRESVAKEFKWLSDRMRESMAKAQK